MIYKLESFSSSSYTRSTVRLTEHQNNYQVTSTQPRVVPKFRAHDVDVGDRFIPRRRGVNFDILHYYHTHSDESETNGDYLDVLKQIKNATERWRKKYVDSAFRYLNIFKGMQCKRVVNIGMEPSATVLRSLGTPESTDHCQWSCRARKQPLMNLKGENSKRYRDHGAHIGSAEIFRFAASIRYPNVIDWSSKNFLAAGLDNALCICDVDFKNSSNVYRIDHESTICCIKWNEAGTQVGISDLSGDTGVFDTNVSKIIWKKKCPNVFSRFCRVVSTVWTRKDRDLVTACDHGCLIIWDSSTGDINNSLILTGLLVVSVDPKEQYLATSGTNKLVKLFLYPSLTQLFEIGFYAPIKGLAWHPWSSGILCIGGGPGDASLSLWNVNSQRQLGYKKVKFVGSVDSLSFNKLSGELLVHWFFLDNNERLRSTFAVLSNLDNVVDSVPIQPEHRMLNILWSPDHTKLAMQHRDTLVIWNFFGNAAHKWLKTKKNVIYRESENNLRNYTYDIYTSTGPYTAFANSRRGKNFTYYNIR